MGCKFGRVILLCLRCYPDKLDIYVVFVALVLPLPVDLVVEEKLGFTGWFNIDVCCILITALCSGCYGNVQEH